MPLIVCPDCNKSVSDAAPACPQCGRPLQAALASPAGASIAPTAKTSPVTAGCAVLIGVVLVMWIVGKCARQSEGANDGSSPRSMTTLAKLVDAQMNEDAPPAPGVLASAELQRLSPLLLEQLGPLKKKWAEVAIAEAQRDSYRVILIYNSSPRSNREIETDTKQITRAMLKVLKADGRDPRGEWINVFVHAREPASGETGTSMWRVYGKSIYNYNNDQIEYKPHGP